MNGNETQPLILGRKRLETRLDKDTLRRLTIVTAGPGFGKTTLLTTCFDPRTSVWHTVTPADRSISALSRSIVRKLRMAVPDISSAVVSAVEGASGSDLSVDSTRPVALAAALAEDLDNRLTHDVTLILDDLHEADGSEDSNAFFAALARYGPKRLRIVTASREPLPFPVSRLSISGDIDEITAADLAFTAGEISSLVELAGGDHPGDLAERVADLTGGWPAAVVLAIQAGLGGGDPESAVREQGPLYDYLAEEALAGEDAAQIEGLRDLALLPWVKPELLKHLGIILEPGLLGPGTPWMTRAPDIPGASAVSPLAKEFFLQSHPADAVHRHRLLTAAAEWYRGEGYLREALDCLMWSGNTEGLAGLLSEYGDVMIAAGLTHQLAEAIASIPPKLVTDDLALMGAEVSQLLGDWEGALDRYREIVPDEGEIPPRTAWRFGFLHHMRGDVTSALEMYQRGALGTDDQASEAALLGWQASAHWLRGDRDLAKGLADRALDLAKRSGDARAMATAHTVLAMVAALDGDRSSNDFHYMKALEYAESGNDVVQTIRIRTNRGSHFLEEGEFGPALVETEIALRLADMTGFELWRGMALANRAQINWFLGKLEEAVADLTEARSTFRRIGSRLEAYPVAHLGDVYSTRGDTAQAQVAYEEAIAMAESENDRQALVPALSGLARLVAHQDPERAVALATKATQVASVIGRAGALVSAGWARLHNDEIDLASEMATDAVMAARGRHDLPGLAEALELEAAIPETANSAALLEEAGSIWDALGVPVGTARTQLALAEVEGGDNGVRRALQAADAMQRLGASGLAIRARSLAETLATRKDLGVRIKTLGGFEVLVDGEAVQQSAWQSRVARELLWMLVAARFRPINREVLIDRIWPDDDPTKAANRLSVGLATIRKVLDPGREFDTNQYLAGDRDAVALVRDSLTIDVEEFLASAKEGRALQRQGKVGESLGELARAEALYVGEFLEEQPYAEWAVSLREEARSEYMSVASALADAAIGEGDYDQAARRYLKMLERDRYNEPAHLGLVTAMERAGRRGTARRLYGIYVARMAELDLEPEPFPGA